jgi:hypothetical protein
LEDDVSLFLSTTCATRYLGEKLKGSFPSSKVGNMKAHIAIDDTDKCHIREIMPLRDHLGADQDIDLFGAHFVQYCGVVIYRFDRVPIEFSDAS